MSARELGKVVAEAFEPDRARLRALVDEQLRERPPTSRSDVPYFDPMTSGTSLPKVGDRPSYEPRSPSEPAPMMTPSRPSQQVPAHLLTSSMTSAGVALPTAAGAPRRALLAMVALLVGALLAVGFWFATRRPATAEGAAVEPTSATTAKAVAPPLATSDATSSPTATAEVPTPQSPIASTNVAPIEPRAKTADARSNARPSSTSAAAVDDDMKRPVAKPKRPIDTTNPYANR